MSTEIVQTTLENGSIISVEADLLGGEEDVAFTSLSFRGVTQAIEGVAESLVKTLNRVKPQRASIELGVAFGIESGALTAVLVKGTGNANLKITLEWGNPVMQIDENS